MSVTKRYRVEFYNKQLLCVMAEADTIELAKERYDKMSKAHKSSKFYTSIELAEVTYDRGILKDKRYLHCFNIKK